MDELMAALGAPPTLESKVRGLMLGLALGDSVGSRSGDIPTSGPLAAGAATQLAAWTAEGVLRAYSRFRSVFPPDEQVVLHALQRWLLLRGGERAPGNAAWLPLQGSAPETGTDDGWLIHVPAMREKRGNSPSTVVAVQQGGPMLSRGCQSLIRTLPVAVLSMVRAASYVPTRSEDPHPRTGEWNVAVAQRAARMSRLTHHDGNKNAVTLVANHIAQGCLHSHGSPTLAIAHPIRALEGGGAAKLREALEAGLEKPADPRLLPGFAPDTSAMSALAGGMYAALSFPGPDTVGEALEFARWAPDGDSVAAVAGAFLGAAHGYEALPVALVSRLELGWVMDRLAIDLIDLLAGGKPGVLGATSGDPLGDPAWLRKYPPF